MGLKELFNREIPFATSKIVAIFAIQNLELVSFLMVSVLLNLNQPPFACDK